VAQETKDWVSEFQSNLAQLEKDVKSQLDALKAQVDRSQETQQAASQPGSIEATIENAERAGNFTCNVTLEDAPGEIVEDAAIRGSTTWARVNLRPGQCRLVVTATGADDKPVSASTVVLVKPSEVARAAVRLPLSQ